MKRIVRGVLVALVLATLLIPSVQGAVARWIFPAEPEHVYPRASVAALVVQHIALAGAAVFLSGMAGVLLGVLVTRPAGEALVPLVQDLASLAQTVPPVAVVALVVPLLGFGGAPTVLALVLFGLLPVLGNTVAGLRQLDRGVVEAATGMGMRPLKRLLIVELPLARHAIIAGIRTTATLSIGTATIGATVGAGGLGVLIIAGIVRDNVAFVTVGALTSAALALATDLLFDALPGAPGGRGARRASRARMAPVGTRPAGGSGTGER